MWACSSIRKTFNNILVLQIRDCLRIVRACWHIREGESRLNCHAERDKKSQKPPNGAVFHEGSIFCYLGGNVKVYHMRHMALQIGIVGLPNVGKSTLFNALIRSRSAEAQNYPFCTIDPNVGIVEVPDKRLHKISEIVNPAKVVPATVEFVDIAGLVAGAHKGEGLGNKFLSHIRECDAICEVIRHFDDPNVTHVTGSVDPKRDVETIEAELILADLQSLEKKKAKYGNAAKTGDKDSKVMMGIIGPLMEALDDGKPASSVEIPEEVRLLLKDLQLLTMKPLLYAVNVSENEISSCNADEMKKKLGVDRGLVVVSAKVEEDLMDLSPEESKEYLEGLGVKSSGLDKLVHAAYDLLGLQTFFTAGPKEAHAWTIRQGATAPEAAGVIHTDFQKGFIRAETIAYDDFIKHNGEQGARDVGKMRSEGKDYVVSDGDVMLFRFNV